MSESINEQIARRVMGFHKIGNNDPATPGDFKLTYGLVFAHRDGDFKRFDPDTNPADAFEVLKKCLEQSPSIRILRGRYYEILDGSESVVEERGMHKTLPAAICAFALRLFPQ